MGFFDDFKWFRPYGDDEEAYTKGISLIGGLIKFESTFSNEIILGLKNENFLGAAFEGLIGHDIDLSLALKVVFEKADGKLESDDLDFLTPESNKISKEIVNKIDEMLKDVLDNRLMVDKSVILNKLEKVFIDKYNEVVKDKFEEIKNEQFFVDDFYQEVKRKLVINDTNFSKIKEKKDEIINKKSEFESLLSSINKVNSECLNITKKIESAIETIDKEIEKKFNVYRKTEEKIEKLEEEISKLKKQKQEIEKIKKIFSNECENILKEEIQIIKNKISPDIEEIKSLSSVLSAFSQKMNDDIEKKQKNRLMDINNGFIRKTKTFKLEKYKKKILDIYDKFYSSTFNIHSHTKQITISNTNLKHGDKAPNKAQLNLIYYTTLLAEKLDEMETNLNDKLKRLIEKEKYNDSAFEKKPPWKENKEYEYTNNVNVISGFNYAAENSPVVWKNADDIIFFEKIFKKIEYGDIASVLSKIFDVVSKIKTIRDYLIYICNIDEDIDKKIKINNEEIEKLKKEKEKNIRIFAGKTIIITIEKFDIELKSFITGV